MSIYLFSLSHAYQQHLPLSHYTHTNLKSKTKQMTVSVSSLASERKGHVYKAEVLRLCREEMDDTNNYSLFLLPVKEKYVHHKI